MTDAKLKRELENYQHTNRVQAEYIGELKEMLALLKRANQTLGSLYEAHKQHSSALLECVKFEVRKK